MSFNQYRPNNFPPVVKNLIIINVLVFIAQLTLTKFNLTDKISLYPLLPQGLHDYLQQPGGLSPEQSFKPYQIATHMFAHSPTLFVHIIFNMFTLWMFGRILENFWGGKRFLLFYLICGVGAAACQLIMAYFRCDHIWQTIVASGTPSLQNLSPDVLEKLAGAVAPALGASGAIMGLLVAFGYLFPNTELYMMFIPIPIKAKWAVIIWAAIDLFGGVANISGDNVAHFAHLGGAITGFIVVMIWNKMDRRRFY